MSADHKFYRNPKPGLALTMRHSVGDLPVLQVGTYLFKLNFDAAAYVERFRVTQLSATAYALLISDDGRSLAARNADKHDDGRLLVWSTWGVDQDARNCFYASDLEAVDAFISMTEQRQAYYAQQIEKLGQQIDNALILYAHLDALHIEEIFT